MQYHPARHNFRRIHIKPGLSPFVFKLAFVGVLIVFSFIVFMDIFCRKSMDSEVKVKIDFIRDLHQRSVLVRPPLKDTLPRSYFTTKRSRRHADQAMNTVASVTVPAHKVPRAKHRQYVKLPRDGVLTMGPKRRYEHKRGRGGLNAKSGIIHPQHKAQRKHSNVL